MKRFAGLDLEVGALYAMEGLLALLLGVVGGAAVGTLVGLAFRTVP